MERSEHRRKRPAGLLAAVAALVIGTTGFVTLPAVPARASIGDCDARFVGEPGWGKVDPDRKDGVSFEFKGRIVYLWQARLQDYSYADVNNYRIGDGLWVDRSLRTMPTHRPDGTPIDKYNSSDQDVINHGGGWKQCGPFRVSHTNDDTYYVDNLNLAVRACIAASGETRCGKWFIDRG